MKAAFAFPELPERTEPRPSHCPAAVGWGWAGLAPSVGP